MVPPGNWWEILSCLPSARAVPAIQGAASEAAAEAAKIRRRVIVMSCFLQTKSGCPIVGRIGIHPYCKVNGPEVASATRRLIFQANHDYLQGWHMLCTVRAQRRPLQRFFPVGVPTRSR